MPAAAAESRGTLRLRAVLFSTRVEILCTQRLCIRDRPAQTWHSRSWGRKFLVMVYPYCRTGYRNKIWQLLFSSPEIGVFINGPTIKGFSEAGPVFRICCSLVGGAARAARSCLCCHTASGVCHQGHLSLLSPKTLQGLCCHPLKTCSGRNVGRVRQQSSPLGEVVDFFFFFFYLIERQQTLQVHSPCAKMASASSNKTKALPTYMINNGIHYREKKKCVKNNLQHIKCVFTDPKVFEIKAYLVMSIRMSILWVSELF